MADIRKTVEDEMGQTATAAQGERGDAGDPGEARSGG